MNSASIEHAQLQAQGHRNPAIPTAHIPPTEFDYSHIPGATELRAAIVAFERDRAADIVEGTGLLRYLETGDLHTLPDAWRQRLEQTHAAIATLQREASAAMPTLHAVGTRMAEAQRRMPNGTFAATVRARLSALPGTPLLLSDIDGTVTKQDHRGPSPVDELLPGSGILDPIYHDRPQPEVERLFPTIATLGWVPLMLEDPDLYAQSGRVAPLRDGADTLGEFAREVYGTGITFVSQGFTESARAIADRVPGAPHDVHAVGPDGVGSALKFHYVPMLAQQHPSRPLIFVGDGGSDRGVAALAEQTGCFAGIFALQGGSFERELQIRGVPHASYTSLNEIVDILDAAR